MKKVFSFLFLALCVFYSFSSPIVLAVNIVLDGKVVDDWDINTAQVVQTNPLIVVPPASTDSCKVDSYAANVTYSTFTNLSQTGQFDARVTRRYDINQHCVSSQSGKLNLLHTYYNFADVGGYDFDDYYYSCSLLDTDASGDYDYQLCFGREEHYCSQTSGGGLPGCTESKANSLKLYTCSGSSSSKCLAPVLKKTYAANNSSGVGNNYAWQHVQYSSQILTHWQNHFNWQPRQDNVVEMQIPFADIGVSGGQNICVAGVSYVLNNSFSPTSTVRDFVARKCHNLLGSSSGGGPNPSNGNGSGYIPPIILPLLLD